MGTALAAELRGNVDEAAAAFAARALQTEQLGRLPEQSVAELLDLGVARLVMPRQWGGAELSFAAVVELVGRLAHGCMSTAWCAALFAEHPWILAHFDEAAQADAWSGGPDVPVSMSVAAMGQGTPVNGGLELRGQWPFVSGCDHAAWFLLASQWPDPDSPAGPPRTGLCLLPRQDVAIDPDSWHVAGLRGTGSKTVHVDGVFVPGHRVRDAAALVMPPVFGAQPTGPLFCQPFGGTLGLVLAAVAVGGAEGAFAHFRQRAAQRVLRHQGRVQAADPVAQVELAEAALRIQSARLLMAEACEIVRVAGEGGAEFGTEALAELRARKAYVVRVSAEAVDRLFAASGGGALHDSQPLQRFWRDVHAIQAHAGMTWSAHAQNYGSVVVGLGPTIQRPW